MAAAAKSAAVVATKMVSSGANFPPESRVLGRDVSDRGCLSSAVLVVVVVVEDATVIAPSIAGQRVGALVVLAAAEHNPPVSEAATETAHEEDADWLHCLSLYAQGTVSTARATACVGVFCKHPKPFCLTVGELSRKLAAQVNPKICLLMASFFLNPKIKLSSGRGAATGTRC